MARAMVTMGLVLVVALLAGMSSSCSALTLPDPILVTTVFLNELKVPVKVIRTSATKVVPPGEQRTFPARARGPVENTRFLIKVGRKTYAIVGATDDSGGRVASETPLVKYYITGNCALKTPGFQWLQTAESLEINTEVPVAFGCAAPTGN